MPQTSCFDPHYAVIDKSFEVRVIPDGPPHGGATYGRLTLQAFTAETPSLDAGAEYLLFRVRITNGQTTGSGACAGCCEHMYLYISDLTLTSDPPDAERYISLPSDPVEWQSGAGCGPTKSTARSWGQIRSLYR